MLLNNSQRLSPKKRDYKVILGSLKAIYGTEQRCYAKLPFTNQAFAKLITQNTQKDMAMNKKSNNISPIFGTPCINE